MSDVELHLSKALKIKPDGATGLPTFDFPSGFKRSITASCGLLQYQKLKLKLKKIPNIVFVRTNQTKM